MALHSKWSGGKQIYYDGTTEPATLTQQTAAGSSLRGRCLRREWCDQHLLAHGDHHQGTAAALTLAAHSDHNDGVIIDITSTNGPRRTPSPRQPSASMPAMPPAMYVRSQLRLATTRAVAYQGEWYVLNNIGGTLV